MPMFRLGRLLATPGALRSITHDDLLASVQRHAQDDWGEVCEEDRTANDAAVNNGSRLLSAHTVNGERIWIITEADRSATTVLLPEEY